MANTGIDPEILTKVHPDNLKAHLKFQTDKSKLKNEFWMSFISKLFSINFLAFFIIFLIILSGFIYLFMVEKPVESLEYWKLILPIITTYIGYIFGKGNNEAK